MRRWGESFLIDAEVSGPPEGVVPKVYRGHYKSFSKEEVDAFLEQVGDSVAEIRSDGIEGQRLLLFWSLHQWRELLHLCQRRRYYYDI